MIEVENEQSTKAGPETTIDWLPNWVRSQHHRFAQTTLCPPGISRAGSATDKTSATPPTPVGKKATQMQKMTQAYKMREEAAHPKNYMDVDNSSLHDCDPMGAIIRTQANGQNGEMHVWDD